jgi:hypothetical protein
MQNLNPRETVGFGFCDLGFGIYYNAVMQLRELNIGCFGGGTGLPSLLGGSRTIPGCISTPS